MHYPFGPGLIRAPEAFKSKGIDPQPGLSEQDRESVLYFYPSPEKTGSLPVLDRFLSERVDVPAGQQLDFAVAAPHSGTFTFMTLGPSDTVLVLFEEDEGGERRFLAGDDDGGADRNARFGFRLEKGGRYILSVRLYFASEEGACAVVWF